MRYSYSVKYGPTFNGLDCGHTLIVRIYSYDGRYGVAS